MQIIQSIQNRIYELRGERVMLDRDLASIYEVETKSLNLAVKRHINRFPNDFMFQLTKQEWDNLRFQFETSSTQIIDPQKMNDTHFVTGRKHGGNRYLPYAFTEQGVAMLSGILNSDRAIQMNIAIMRAFVELRKVLLLQTNIKEQLKELKERVCNHDGQLSQIYDALENLLDEKAATRKWDERERIGYKQQSN